MNTGAENVAVGMSALRLTDVGYNSTAIGVNALYNNKSSDMLAVGNRALGANTTGLFPTAVGTYAMQNSKEASYNTAVGYGTLNKNNDGTPAGGSWNAAVGNYTLLQNTTGHSNVSVGYSSMYKNTTGTWNTCVGGAALYENTIGYIGPFLWESQGKSGADSGFGFDRNFAMNRLGQVADQMQTESRLDAHNFGFVIKRTQLLVADARAIVGNR